MNKKVSTNQAIIAFSKMSVWIVAPVLIGLFFGKLIDARFNFSPYGLLVMISFSFLVSCFGIVREAQKYLRNLDKNKNE